MNLKRRLKDFAREAYFDNARRLARVLIRGRRGPRAFGRVGVVAAMYGRNGITHGAAMQVEALRQAGYAADLIDASPAVGRPTRRVPHTPADAYVFHSGGPETSNLVLAVLPHAAAAYRIAYWAWELPQPPKRWPPVRGVFDEIWTPSAFSRDSLRQRYGDVPVNVVGHRVVPQTARRRAGGGPFTVLAMGDSRSSFARKNLAGAVAAFTAAFGDSPDARLLLKVNGKAGQAASLPEAWTRPANVTLIDRYLDDAALGDLYGSADVLLSLHRAEGFGLPMLEAMARGIPVVGTGWSGNLEFMDEGNSALVPWRPVAVDDAATYLDYADATWAEPDTAAAADALRRLSQDRPHYDRLAAAAHAAAVEYARAWDVPAAAERAVVV